MSVNRPTIAELTTRTAVLIRSEVNNAAGSDGVLQSAEHDALTPFVQRAAAGLSTVNEVVDAAMGKAVTTWARFNQATGPGKAWLSQAELSQVQAADSDLGVLTTGALVIAKRVKGTRAPLSVTLDAPAGVSMGVRGVRVLDVSVSAGPTVPVGTRVGLIVDGQRLELERTPGGLDVWNLKAPEGYGLEVISRGPVSDPTSTVRLKITRDAETALPHVLVVQRANAALTSFVKHERMDDADWAQNFPTTWAGNVARGVPAEIDAFFASPTTEVHRRKDTVLFVGRGPYALYTEVEVEKSDGALVRAFVEID